MRCVNASFLVTIIALLFALGPRDRALYAKDESNNTDQRDAELISAEVHGTLHKKPIGPGQADIYFIVVKAAPFFEENRVWLLRSEDKNRALDRQLIELTAKEVVAKGQLKQLSGNAQGVVPAQGMYLEASGPSFKIMEPGKE
jgi:hypothetical protein